MEKERKRSRSAPSAQIVSTGELTKRRKKKPQLQFPDRKINIPVESHTRCAEEMDGGCIPCEALQCDRVFKSTSDLEFHMRSAHRHVCCHCKKIWESSHHLDVHILEWHDTMFEFLAKKKPMFECLDPDCGNKFSTYKKRREHIMKQHHFPAAFLFDQMDFVKVKRAKKKEKLKQKAASELDREVQATDANHLESKSNENGNGEDTAPVESLRSDVTGGSKTHGQSNVLKEQQNNGSDGPGHGTEVAMATCGGRGDSQDAMEEEGCSEGDRAADRIRVPRSICFGQGSQKAFTHHGRNNKHWHQLHKPRGKDGAARETSVNIEQVQMSDLSEALDTVT